MEEIKRMAHKKLIALLSATVMACSLFAGCGASSSGSSAASSATSSSGSSSAVTAASGSTSAASSGTTASSATTSTTGGKHINAALYWFGTSLDPATEYDGWTTCRAGITETLVTVDQNYELQPLLADSWKQTDDTTWVFHIRDGVTFQDGTPVDAAACKASIERAMQIQDRAKTAAKIDTIEADGQNLTIKTTEPFGAFLANLSEPLYSIIKVGDDQDYANKPIGTGPFMVTDFTVNDKIDEVKYDGYWNGASDVDSITITCIEDDSTRGLALQSGEQDIVQRVASTDIDTFANDSSYQALNTTGARIRLLLLNEKNEALADSNVRKALADSIDYDSLVSILGSGVTEAGAPYPESAPYGYDELDRQSFNLDEAKSLLEQEGYTDTDGDGIVDKDGTDLSLKLTYSMSDYTTMLEAVQSMAKEAGIDIQLNLVDDITEATDNKDYDILCTNWQCLSTGDPQWFLDQLYKTDGPDNSMSYSNSDLDNIISQLSTTFDTDGREKLTIEAEKILLKDTASIWLVGEKNYVVANDKVTNITPYPIDYYFIDNKLSIND